MKKVVKVISNSLLVLFIAVLLVYFALRLTNVIGIYKVLTDSSEININSGDYLVVLKRKEYKVDDIVILKIGKSFAPYKIIDVEEDKIITKRNIKDTGISSQDVVGKVIYKSKILNFIMNYKYIIIGIILVLYIITDLINKDKKEDKIEVVEIL